MSKKKKKKQNNQQAVSMPDQNGQQRIPTKEELINEQIINLVCEVCIFKK